MHKVSTSRLAAEPMRGKLPESTAPGYGVACFAGIHGDEGSPMNSSESCFRWGFYQDAAGTLHA
jgi:hypothetical protein